MVNWTAGLPPAQLTLPSGQGYSNSLQLTNITEMGKADLSNVRDERKSSQPVNHLVREKDWSSWKSRRLLRRQRVKAKSLKRLYHSFHLGVA